MSADGKFRLSTYDLRARIDALEAALAAERAVSERLAFELQAASAVFPAFVTTNFAQALAAYSSLRFPDTENGGDRAEGA